MAGYREARADQLTAGDAVLVKYYDEHGAYMETHCTAEAVSTRRYGRGSRVTVRWSGNWGTESYSPDKVFGVRDGVQ